MQSSSKAGSSMGGRQDHRVHKMTFSIKGAFVRQKARLVPAVSLPCGMTAKGPQVCMICASSSAVIRVWVGRESLPSPALGRLLLSEHPLGSQSFPVIEPEQGCLQDRASCRGCHTDVGRDGLVCMQKEQLTRYWKNSVLCLNSTWNIVLITLLRLLLSEDMLFKPKAQQREIHISKQSK